jgi:hypothetical protein
MPWMFSVFEGEFAQANYAGPRKNQSSEIPIRLTVVEIFNLRACQCGRHKTPFSLNHLDGAAGSSSSASSEGPITGPSDLAAARTQIPGDRTKLGAASPKNYERDHHNDAQHPIVEIA